jgi:hypothetical protein
MGEEEVDRERDEMAEKLRRGKVCGGKPEL